MMNDFKVSIIIPCYNEKNTIEKILSKVKISKIHNKEIIIVDDNSNDGSKEIIKKLANSGNDIDLKAIFHEKNLGKGAAIKSGMREASGDIILIQDADLEYDPDDYPKMMDPFLRHGADVVYGSRFMGGEGPRRLLMFWHEIANRILTLMTNIVTNLNMTDMETGYKAFKKECISADELKENSFSIEPELTIKLARKKLKFYEVSISYHGRSYEQGKKITFIDAVMVFFVILKYTIIR